MSCLQVMQSDTWPGTQHLRPSTTTTTTTLAPPPPHWPLLPHSILNPFILFIRTSHVGQRVLLFQTSGLQRGHEQHEVLDIDCHGEHVFILDMEHCGLIAYLQGFSFTTGYWFFFGFRGHFQIPHTAGLIILSVCSNAICLLGSSRVVSCQEVAYWWWRGNWNQLEGTDSLTTACCVFSLH